MVGAQPPPPTVHHEFAVTASDDDQHVDLTVHMGTDLLAGVEPDEIGVQVTAVGQAPHRPARARGFRSEIYDQRVLTGVVVEEVSPAWRVAAELAATHRAAAVNAFSASSTIGNSSLFSLWTWMWVSASSSASPE